MMTISEIVKGHTAHLQWYRAGNLMYKTSSGFEFPVPISDTGDATFGAEEKALTLMRWIRAQHELVSKQQQPES